MNTANANSAPSNGTLEGIYLSMQRMELNVLRLMHNLNDRVASIERKIDGVILNGLAPTSAATTIKNEQVAPLPATGVPPLTTTGQPFATTTAPPPATTTIKNEPVAASPATTAAPPSIVKPSFAAPPATSSSVKFSFAPPAQPSTEKSPFVATPAQPTTFKSPFASAAATPLQSSAVKAPFGGTSTGLSFSALGGNNSFLDKKSGDVSNTSFGAVKSNTFGAKEGQEEGNENPEEYVPDAHYEPVVPLPDKVDVVTGEEGEDVLFKNRAKLYVFTESREVKERGVGDLKILYDPKKKSYRVVMRREQVHKLCANFRISSGMTITDKAGTKNCGCFSCLDFSEDGQNGVQSVFYVRFREDSVYEEFKKLFTEIASGAHSGSSGNDDNAPKPPPPSSKSNDSKGFGDKASSKPQPPPSKPDDKGFGDKFTKKQGEWDCETCYVRNDAGVDVCVSCGTGKDGKAKSEPAFKPTTFGAPSNSTFSFGFKKEPVAESPATTAASPFQPSTVKSPFAAPTTTASSVKFSFAPPAQPSTEKSPFTAPPPQASAVKSPFVATPAQPTTFKSPFASAAATPLQSSAVKAPFGGTSTGLSFAALGGNNSFLDKKSGDVSNTSFGAMKSNTFGTKEGQEEGNENPEEYVPDAHYEPVVPLPDKVDVVTGEEGEDVLFKNRAKLYVFTESREVKERGVGDLKILYDPKKKSYRVVMRREQVHKLCANFRILSGMTITDKAGTKNCGVLQCHDFSEDVQNGVQSVFYVRFREDSVYEEFKKLFTDIASGAHSGSKPVVKEAATTSKAKTPEKANLPTLPSIALSNNPSVEDEVDEEEGEYDEGEDYEDEENFDGIIMEADCKLSITEAYKSPLAKMKSSDEVFDNIKFCLMEEGEGIYRAEFYSKDEEDPIFPHYLQDDIDYKIDGKKITFIARNDKGTRKALSCEFKDSKTAEETFDTLVACRDSNGAEDEEEEA